MVFSSAVTVVINRLIAIVRDICFKASRAFMMIWLEIMDRSEQNSKHQVKLNNVEGSTRDLNASLEDAALRWVSLSVACKRGVSCVRRHLAAPGPQCALRSGRPGWRGWSPTRSGFSSHREEVARYLQLVFLQLEGRCLSAEAEASR